MLTVVFLCMLSVFCGMGIIRLIRLRLDQRCVLFFAPLVTLTYWSIVLGNVVAFRIPVKQIYIPLWGLTIGLSIYGIFSIRWRDFLREGPLLGVVFLTTLITTMGYVWFGFETFLGSPAMDGWSYMAFGQYLWEFPRGTEGGLAPLYQYSAHLSFTRFVAPSILAFFSPLSGLPGDTQPTVGYLISIAFFVYASSTAFFAQAIDFNKRLKFFFPVLVVFSSWSLYVIKANNFDNVLLLGYLPAIAGIFYLIEPDSISGGILLGLLGAGSAYIYPEMLPFVLAAMGLWGLHKLFFFYRRGLLRPWIYSLMVATCVLFLAVFSSLKQIAQFLIQQASISNNAVRPGWDVVGFELPNNFGIAYWGFGEILNIGENPLIKILFFLFISFLFCLVAYGCAYLCVKKLWGSLGVFIFLNAALLYLVFFQKYGYGAYKISLLLWWLLVYVTMAGYLLLKKHLLALSSRINLTASIIIGACVIAGVAITGNRFYSFNKQVAEKSITTFNQVRAVKRLISHGSLLVSVSDTMANLWAMYYLRDVPILIYPYRGYAAQSHVTPLMDRSSPVSLSTIRYVLTDHQTIMPSAQTTLVWTGERYKLWHIETKDWAFIVDIKNPNGVESWNNWTGLWLGQKETSLDVISSCSRNAILSAEFSPGPSIPGSQERHLAIKTDKGYQSLQTILGVGPQFIDMPLDAGRNQIDLLSLDKPSLSVLPNGDSRPMLIGMRDPKLKFKNAE